MSKFKALPPDLARPRPDVKARTHEWDEWVMEIQHYLGYRVCGVTNRKGTPCTQKPVPDRNRCKYHGGHQPRGPASTSWKTGKYSVMANALPAKMQDSFEAIMADTRLLQLDADIAVMELRQSELLEALRDGLDPAAALRNVLAGLEDLTLAVAEGNPVSISLAAEIVADAARAGVDTADTWRGFMQAGEHKRKLIETEGKRLERMQAFITAEEARARDRLLMAVVLKAVEAHAPGRPGRMILGELAEAVAQLAGAPLVPIGKQIMEVSPRGQKALPEAGGTEGVSDSG